jgi:hypothetical protein
MIKLVLQQCLACCEYIENFFSPSKPYFANPQPQSIAGNQT